VLTLKGACRPLRRFARRGASGASYAARADSTILKGGPGNLEANEDAEEDVLENIALREKEVRARRCARECFWQLR
jgi:hypothetical protein